MCYSDNMEDFDYLSEGAVYLDSACQSLRPRPVINALERYYTEHNSCGERVKYKWGKVTDAKVEETREKTLKYLGVKAKKYTVSFTLNTTYGLNLVLSQLKPEAFSKVMTSDIEHNSPFLATMALAARTGWPREIMERNEDGTIDVSKYDFSNAVVVVNSTSNFDGARTLKNIAELSKAVHKAHGILVIDAAQGTSHTVDVVRGQDYDVLCFSAHKMYGPSLGGIVWKDELAEKIFVGFVGGGMVDDVERDKYVLSAEGKEHRYTRFEAGLMAWGEIVALGETIDWLEKVPKSDWKCLHDNCERLFRLLDESPKVHLVSKEPSTTMSFYVEGLDSHLLGEALSREDIMARTGYFCAHYYLDHVRKMPPLMRFSLGLHNRASDIDKVERVLGKIIA